MALFQNEVNRKNSNTWNKCNSDARSGFFRNQFIAKFGGSFSKLNNSWIWEENKTEEQVKLIVPTVEPIVKKKISKITVFEDSVGKRFEVTNISSFCKENGLSNSTIFDLIAGRRKTHKGFKYIETIEPTE